jgi:hypothetical protein
VAKILVGFLM